MQYKIPIQIENEDTIFLGLSLRQLIIIMMWAGMAYGLFKYLEERIGSEIALVLAIPLLIIGISIALTRIAEMTFLPLLLNAIRLFLNTKSRTWSQGTDSYSELEIGYISMSNQKKQIKNSRTFSQIKQGDDDFSDKLKHL